MPSPARSGDSPDPASPSPEEAPARPRLRTAAAVLLALEALLVAAAATYSFAGVADGALDARLGTGLGVFMLVFALAVGVAARSIVGRGRFGLGFGITWQLFQALVGATMINSGLLWPGTLALALAIAAFVLLTKLVTSTPLPGREE